MSVDLGSLPPVTTQPLRPRKVSARRRVRERLPGAFIAGRSPEGWFEVRRVDARTILIHERRYWQRNSNYLLLGDDRALLVDTGSGLSELRALVDVLTDLPVTVLPTHLHFDHIGGIERFEHRAMLDIPSNRGLVRDGLVRTSYSRSLSLAGHAFAVDEWVAPGESIDLGSRRLEVLATPGHSCDGLTLVDRAARLACVGDIVYAGLLLAVFPGARVEDYSRSLEVLARRDDLDLLLPGHGPPLPAAVLSGLARGVRLAQRSPVRFPLRLVRPAPGFLLLARS